MNKLTPDDICAILHGIAIFMMVITLGASLRQLRETKRFDFRFAFVAFTAAIVICGVGAYIRDNPPN